MFLLYPGGWWFGVVVLVLTVAISWLFLRHIFFRGLTGRVPLIADGGEDYLRILKRRYASGEITREEYLRMRDELKD